MSQSHSPEPWKLQKSSHDSICDANGNRINKCEMSEHLGQLTPRSKMSLDDRERIVACVNACAGIPTEELVRARPGHTTMAIETLDMLARFYQQGGLDTVPANCQVTPRIHYEVTPGHVFFGKMLNPKSWNNCQAAISVCRNAGYKVTNPDGTEIE